MIPEAAAAREQFLAAKAQLLAAFDRVPLDRQSWSPAPTARTPIEIVAHCAEAIQNLGGMIAGRPFSVPSTGEADKVFRANEATVSLRQEALDLLERNSEELLEILEALTPPDLDRPFVAPFGMGELPLAASLSFPADHTRWHVGQIEYIQTIYGDRDWGF